MNGDDSYPFIRFRSEKLHDFFVLGFTAEELKIFLS